MKGRTEREGKEETGGVWRVCGVGGEGIGRWEEEKAVRGWDGIEMCSFSLGAGVP